MIKYVEILIFISFNPYICIIDPLRRQYTTIALLFILSIQIELKVISCMNKLK
jgi:hypothetical protein